MSKRVLRGRAPYWQKEDCLRVKGGARGEGRPCAEGGRKGSVREGKGRGWGRLKRGEDEATMTSITKMPRRTRHVWDMGIPLWTLAPYMTFCGLRD